MSAFGYGVANQIEQNIRALFLRVKAVSRTALTHEEFASLFIPAAQRDMYREMATLAHTHGSTRGEFKWGRSKLIFRMIDCLGDKHALPIPRDMVLQCDAPPELVERISTWLVSGGDASGDFGRVLALFKFFNENLTKGQIRFVWPSILAILGASPVLDETLKALQEIKVPMEPPQLPRGLLAICRKTAESVATSGLIAADVSTVVHTEGWIETADNQKHDEPGIGAFLGIS